MNKLPEPATPATQKPKEDVFFALQEAENLLQAARNRIAEAVVRIYDAAEVMGELTAMARRTDEVLKDLTDQANVVRKWKDKAAVEANAAQRSWNKKGGAR